MRKIVLASASPRRKELLKLMGLRFSVDPGDYEEDMTLRMPPSGLAEFLSLQKAASVAGRHPDALVIAADTFIVFREKLLGKPHTHREAVRMLRELSGNSHDVITGFTVLDTYDGRHATKSVRTHVVFKKMTDDEIEAYAASGEPLDKAGAYAIQGLGALFVRKIDGDYFNVIGLPVSSLADVLKKFGVKVL